MHRWVIVVLVVQSGLWAEKNSVDVRIAAFAEDVIAKVSDYYAMIGGPGRKEVEELVLAGAAWAEKYGHASAFEARMALVMKGLAQIATFKDTEIPLASILYEPAHDLMLCFRQALSFPGQTNRFTLIELALLPEITDVHQATRAQVGYWRYFTGIESFFEIMHPGETEKNRLRTIHFYETSVLRLTFRGGNKRTFRVYSEARENDDTYSSGLLTVENWIADGAPHAHDKRLKAVELFKKYWDLQNIAWDISVEAESASAREQLGADVDILSDSIDQFKNS